MKYDVPVYDPFAGRGDDHYHPDNEAAERLTQVELTHRDIATLFGMLGRAASVHEEKLLTKFIVVEYLSLDEHLLALVGLALSGRSGYPLGEAEAAELKRLNGAYTALRKTAEPALREIRNKVAAHRDSTSLLATARIWDGVDAATVHRIARPINPLFSFLSRLNIYRWTKQEVTEGGPVVAFVSPLEWGTLEIEPTGEGQGEADPK